MTSVRGLRGRRRPGGRRGGGRAGGGAAGSRTLPRSLLTPHLPRTPGPGASLTPTSPTFFCRPDKCRGVWRRESRLRQVYHLIRVCRTGKTQTAAPGDGGEEAASEPVPGARGGRGGRGGRPRGGWRRGDAPGGARGVEGAGAGAARGAGADWGGARAGFPALAPAACGTCTFSPLGGPSRLTGATGTGSGGWGSGGGRGQGGAHGENGRARRGGVRAT